MHFRRFSLFPLFSNFSDAAGYFGFLVRGIDSNLIWFCNGVAMAVPDGKDTSLYGCRMSDWGLICAMWLNWVPSCSTNVVKWAADCRQCSGHSSAHGNARPLGNQKILYFVRDSQPFDFIPSHSNPIYVLPYLSWFRLNNLFITPTHTRTHARTHIHTYICVCVYIYICVCVCVCVCVGGGRDSAACIATRYGLDGHGIESRWGRDFPHPSRPALGLTQAPIQRVLGLFPGDKAAGAWSWPPTPI